MSRKKIHKFKKISGFIVLNLNFKKTGLKKRKNAKVKKKTDEEFSRISLKHQVEQVTCSTWRTLKASAGLHIGIQVCWMTGERSVEF